MLNEKIAIIGTGNIGGALARGFLEMKAVKADNLYLTRRRAELISGFADEGCRVSSDNRTAVRKCGIVILAVEPHQVDKVLDEIGADLNERHILVSVATAVSVAHIAGKVAKPLQIVRAMPNTAISMGESMTCLSAVNRNDPALEKAKELFNMLGSTLVIEETQMTSATALAACGIAFFLRAIRAASQGGIEIGFSAEEALSMAAQTAKGAAALLLKNKRHPEFEIDKVTTPLGCTIAGLNKMEHAGFSSALIQGIVTSANKAEGLAPE